VGRRRHVRPLSQPFARIGRSLRLVGLAPPCRADRSNAGDPSRCVPEIPSRRRARSPSKENNPNHRMQGQAASGLRRPESHPGGVVIVNTRSRAGERARSEEPRAAGSNSEAGSRRQGQRAGQSRSSDGGSHPGVHETAGVGERRRGLESRATTRLRPGRRKGAERAGSAPGASERFGCSRSQAGCNSSSDLCPGFGQARTARAGHGGTAARSSRARGRRSLWTINRRVGPIRAGAAFWLTAWRGGVEFIVHAGRRGLAAPPGTCRRLCRGPVRRWPALRAHAASRVGCAPRRAAGPGNRA
jgi:hypothetical protein